MGQKGRGRISGFFGDKKENRLLKVWAGEEPILIGRYQFWPHSHLRKRTQLGGGSGDTGHLALFEGPTKFCKVLRILYGRAGVKKGIFQHR